MDQIKQVLEIAGEKGIIQARDVEGAGISRNYLYKMLKSGLLVKAARGLYALPDAPVTDQSSLAEIAKRVPNAIVCLISALSFHGITTQIPHEIWIAVPRGSWRPGFDYPPLNLTYVSGVAYAFGVREHDINGVIVKVYSPAKTVADCFKFRNKVGLDVAIEALRETWHSRMATMDELVEAAGMCKVARVMRPYLEAIV